MEEENMKVSSSPQAGEGKNVNRTKNVRLFVIGAAGLLILAFAASLGFLLYRVYGQTATDSLTIKAAKVLRLPALKVNGERVLYSDYADDLKAINTLQAYNKAKAQGGGGDLTESQLTDQVVSRLVNNILIKKLVRDNGITASAEDINKVKEEIRKSFPSEDDLNKELVSRYGWSFSEYAEKVIKPYVLENKLSEVVSKNKEAIEKVREAAAEVLEKIKQGADFSEMAKKYSEDGTAKNGGDLGWFGKGQMVPQFEAAVFALKSGEVAPELVETEYGFHIIKTDETRTTKVKNEKGKMVDQEEVKARHILFLYPSLSKYMRDLLANAAIHIYIKIHNPFAEGQI